MKPGAILLICGIVALAQQAPPPRTFGAYAGSLGAITSQPVPVTGAPYSGELVTSSTQVLPDGTKIERPGPMRKMYRDGQGRVREENVLGGRRPNGEPIPERSVSIARIMDPVAEYSYALDPVNKIAHRSKAPVRQQPPNRAKQPAGPGAPGVTRESLGIQFVNDLAAEGERITSTIPAGMQGNDRPMIQVTETWTSVELKVLVRQVNQSPVNGATLTELKNVLRQEPDPALFQIPPDYKIVDDTGSFVITF